MDPVTLIRTSQLQMIVDVHRSESPDGHPEYLKYTWGNRNRRIMVLYGLIIR